MVVLKYNSVQRSFLSQENAVIMGSLSQFVFIEIQMIYKIHVSYNIHGTFEMSE